MIREGFKFTKENYIESYSGSNYLDCPAENDSIKSFLNGVKPLYRSPLAGTGEEDILLGKTIDYYEFLDNKKLIFLGFTDNTFCIRMSYKMRIGTVHEGYDYETYTFAPSVYSHFVLVDYYENYNDEYGKVKITKFGKWLAEHTDIDVVSFYETVKAKRLEIDEFRKKSKREDEIKQFYFLKEKLGL